MQSDLARVVAEQAKLSEIAGAPAGRQSLVERQLNEQLRAATEQIASLQASLDAGARSASIRTRSSPPPAPAIVSTWSRRRPTSKELTAQIAAARAAEQQVREKLAGRVNGELATVAEVRAQIATAQAQVKVAQAQVETTRAKIVNAQLRPDADHGDCARQRHDGERDAPAGLFRRRCRLFRGDDLRRHRVPGLCALQPERAAPGRTRERSGDHARHLPGPCHQSACGFGDLGAVAGADRRQRQSASDDLQPAAGTVPRQAGRRPKRTTRSSSPPAPAAPPRSTPSTCRSFTSFARC